MKDFVPLAVSSGTCLHPIESVPSPVDNCPVRSRNGQPIGNVRDKCAYDRSREVDAARSTRHFYQVRGPGMAGAVGFNSMTSGRAMGIDRETRIFENVRCALSMHARL